MRGASPLAVEQRENRGQPDANPNPEQQQHCRGENEVEGCVLDEEILVARSREQIDEHDRAGKRGKPAEHAAQRTGDRSGDPFSCGRQLEVRLGHDREPGQQQRTAEQGFQQGIVE